MSATPLQVYEAIKPKLGEKESQLLLEHITRQTEISAKDLATKADMEKLAGTVERLATTVEKLAAGMERFATKADIRDMATKTDIRDMATKTDIRDMATKTELAAVRGEMAAMREQMATLATREELAKLEARLIRWNVGTIIAVAGLTLAIAKLIG